MSLPPGPGPGPALVPAHAPPPPPPVPLALLGAGGVGRALLRQIVANRARHAAELGLALDVRAVCDRTGAVVADRPAALADEALLDIAAHKAGGGTLRGRDGAVALAPGTGLGALLAHLDAPALIVVDCTATDEVTPHLLRVLARGRDVVLANKLPLTGDLATWDAFAGRAPAAALGPARGRVRWETTVAAAVPVIATLRRLLNAGDEVARIAGSFSGSLNHLATELRAGRRFSDIVREARDRHYLEPDPRTDLGGRDMARKALILARMLGARLTLEEVAAEPLFPPALAEVPVAAFYDALPTLDQAMAASVAAAQAAGGVWRYAAEVTSAGAAVGPTVAPADSPLGRMRGTDNHVAFHTRWYADSPLVLEGRGAGVEATASGVLADIVELALGARA